MSKNNLIKPNKLSSGDTIGIISPAGAVKDDNLWNPTIKFFENKGYKVKIADNAKSKNNYLAGKDQDRLSDLINFFEDKNIKAIICSRGGYGTFRLLDSIDYNIINNNPKIFVGYSDITALLLAFLNKSNLVTFHGPLALSDFGKDKIDEYTQTSFLDTLEGNIKIPYNYYNPINYECLNPGKTTSELIACNLSILTGLLGTPYFPDINGKILVLEDIGEPLYKIDRMLMQLKLAGVFNKVSALLFGEFTSIVESDDPETARFKLIDLIKELTSDVNLPIGYGFAATHGEHKATLPLGLKYHFNSAEFCLTLLDQCTK